MFLFFDTETTGLPKNYQAPIEDLQNWPRLVQIAWQRYNDQGGLIESRNYIIKPNGFVIPEEVAKIHRISTERALKEGIPLEEALFDFSFHLDNAQLLIAHNINFDEKIVGAEFLRTGLKNNLASIKKFCTMQESVNFCRIPTPRGYFKWPNLTELHQQLFGEDFNDAHDAAYDVNACARCFFELRKRGVFKF
ncbi:MAG: 3'-5' exonuclease [Planctomycetes bacterium]|jgi:DNA polymerase III epsilon subunit-like protein|nr:3'-5' exonuclease [Planctomycetota bacterium]